MAAAQPAVTMPHSAPVRAASRFPTASINSSRSMYDRDASSMARFTSGKLCEPEMMVNVPLQLISGRPDLLAQNTGVALDRLMDGGALPPKIGAMLRRAFVLFSDLNQVLRVSVVSNSEPASWPAPLKARLVQIAGVADFEALETRLCTVQADVRQAFVQLIGPPGDGSAAPARLI